MNDIKSRRAHRLVRRTDRTERVQASELCVGDRLLLCGLDGELDPAARLPVLGISIDDENEGWLNIRTGGLVDALNGPSSARGHIFCEATTYFVREVRQVTEAGR